MSDKYNICHISRLRMGIDGDGIRELVLTAGCSLRCRYCINPFTWDGSEKIEQLTAQEIYERIKLDRPYILATNGGITIGGGEPLLQPQLFKELRMLMEKEMTLYAETSFNVPYENICGFEKYIDRFYVDIKTVDEEIYRNYTGGEIICVLDNIQRFVESFGSDKIVVRIPIIPNFTDEENQIDSKKKLEDFGIKKFDLFNYRL